MSALLGHLRRMGHEVQDLVDPGWTMFWIFDVAELAPRSGSDAAVGDAEFLECNLITPNTAELTLPDFWRVAPTGLATLIRPYREDRRNIGSGFQPGTWFWPYVMAREIAEVVRHARAFADRFETPESVSFRAEWNGLKGRELRDPNNPLLALRHSGHSPHSDSRVVTRTVPVADLTSRWADITAGILSAITRMFDARLSISSQEVLAWSKKFRS